MSVGARCLRAHAVRSGDFESAVKFSSGILFPLKWQRGRLGDKVPAASSSQAPCHMPHARGTSWLYDLRYPVWCLALTQFPASL
jgi:hypothetical protein